VSAGKQLDNSTFVHKARLRERLLRATGERVHVLETHGGWGRLFDRVWFRAAGGVVLELKPNKAEHLARQRPAWSAFEGDALAVLQAGGFSQRAFDIVDLDPYGSTLEYLPALFAAGRTRPASWSLVANCGLRQNLQIGGGWHVKALTPYVPRFGNDLFGQYLELLHVMLREQAHAVGEQLVHFEGYYCGAAHCMTHYLARFERRK
jgi:hypothetical protein